MAQCCYSENTGRVEQTGCERETKEKNTEGEREREKADGTITKLKEEADGKTGMGGGGSL